VRAALVAAAAVAVALAALTGNAPARTVANECRGLPVCVPIAGPWVVVPARSGPRPPRVDYLLSCPRGFIVAGTDALVADRATDVAIRGEPGSPVAPGVTVGRDVLFTAVHTGSARTPTSFRPFLGCVPASGGGGRSQTVYTPRGLYAVHPTRPLVRQISVARLTGGPARTVVSRCSPGGRLLDGSNAVGFYTQREPSAALLGAVSVSQTIQERQVVARVRLAIGGAPRSEIQVHALCTRAGR